MAVTFALVHGAWHGGWSWERLDGPLRRRGHRVVAVDLPGDDPDAGLEEYARTIDAQLPASEEDVVVVAHSLNGLVAPLVAKRRPLTAIVYLGAFVPLAGRSMSDQFAASSEPVLLLEGGRETDELGRSRWTDPDTTARLMYPDLSAEDVEWAFTRLRPQAPRPQLQPHPIDAPDVRVSSLVCSDDRVVNPAWSRRVARERLGVEPVELPTGHFPMIAAPEVLADALTEVAA